MATIMEVFNEAPIKMIFDVLTDMPWSGLYESTDLNMLYLSHAGSRDVSPLINMIKADKETLDDNDRQRLGVLITAVNKQNWKYQWDALFANYNPIENYRMVEEEKSKNTNIIEATDSNTLSSTNTNTRDTTSSSNGSNNTTTDNKVYGYDSNGPTNDSSNTVAGTNSNTITDTGTVTDSRSDTSSGTNSSTNNGTEDRTLTRSGNIGVTTSQQMITSELDLRKVKYLDIVMRDIDDMLCSHVISIE